MKGYNYYSESFKRDVVREILNGHISKANAKRKYGIRGCGCIISWIRKFEESAPQHSTMDYRKTDKKELIKRIKELERQLEDEQIRSFGYNRMIDIAEEQLNITIRKKPDTKQSKK
jgi:transposase-like protein